MGKCYYTGLKEIYKRKEEGSLEVTNEAEDEDPKLMRALTAVFSKKRNLLVLREWLRYTPLCNQRNLAALFKTCASMSPRHSTEFNELGIALMEWIARHKVEVHYPQEVLAMRSYMNYCLLKTVADFKKHGMTKTEWWANYKHIGRLVLDPSAADRCFACNGNMLDVQADLAALMTSGELAQSLFGGAWNEVASDKVRLIMQQSFAALQLKKKVDLDTVNNALKALKDKAAEAGCSAFDSGSSTSKVTLRYLGYDLEVASTSIMDEMGLRTWAHIKSAALVGAVCRRFGASRPSLSPTPRPMASRLPPRSPPNVPRCARWPRSSRTTRMPP